jgi:hypothetical protein
MLASVRERLPPEPSYCIDHGVEADRAALDVFDVDQSAQAIAPLISGDAVQAVAQLYEKPRFLDSQSYGL